MAYKKNVIQEAIKLVTKLTIINLERVTKKRPHYNLMSNVVY